MDGVCDKRHERVWVKEKDAQDRSLWSRKLLLVTSNPRFSVDKLT